MVSRKMSRRLRAAVAAENADGVVDVAGIDGIALLDEAVELLEHPPGELALDLVAADVQRVAGDADAHAERALEALRCSSW